MVVKSSAARGFDSDFLPQRL